MITRRIGHLAVLALCTTALVACGSDDVKVEFEAEGPTGTPVEIRMKFAPGLSTLVRMKMDVQTETRAEGNTADISMSMGTDMQLDVLGVEEDGIGRVQVTYKAISMKMEGAGQSVEYDSATGVASPSRMKILGRLVDKRFVVHMRPDGTVTDTEGLDAIMDEFRGVPGMGDPGALVKSLEQMTMFFPDRPVDNGDSWKKTIEMESPAPIRMDMDCMLLSHDEASATIGINSDVSLTGMPTLPPGSDVNVKGTMSGKSIMDLRTGSARKLDAKMKLGGKIHVQGTEVEFEADYDIRFWTVE